MRIEIRSTPLATKLINSLRGDLRRSYDRFEDELAIRGCAALDYRLSGEQLEHLCVAHLANSLRVIVAFEEPTVAYVVTIGTHDESNPALDVYNLLYQLAGHAPKERIRRTKPPCCGVDTGEPLIDANALDDLFTRMPRVSSTNTRRLAQKVRSGGRRSKTPRRR